MRAIVVVTAIFVLPGAYEVRADTIHEAVRTGDFTQVAALLQEDPTRANLIESGLGRFTPLYCAVQRDNYGIAALLVAHKADVNAKVDDALPTAFHLAAWNGNKKLVALFLLNGAKLDIFVASAVGTTDQVRVLLRAEPKLAIAKDDLRQSPLHWAATRGNTEAIKLLLASGADLKTHSKHDTTPLHEAALENQTGAADVLIEAGADVNVKGFQGQTPLHCAARSGHRQIAELLLRRKADVNSKMDIGGLGTIEVNGDAGDPYPLDARMSTPLHEAATWGNTALIDLLLAKGADLKAKDKWGQTALHSAALNNRRAAVELLLNKGANVNARDRQDCTPLGVVRVGQDTATVAELLRKAGGKK